MTDRNDIDGDMQGSEPADNLGADAATRHLDGLVAGADDPANYLPGADEHYQRIEDLALIALLRDDSAPLLPRETRHTADRLEALTARVNELEAEVESVRSEAAHIASRYLAMIDARDLAISEFDTEHEELERSYGLLLNEQNARAKAEATLAKVCSWVNGRSWLGTSDQMGRDALLALLDGNGGDTE